MNSASVCWMLLLALSAAACDVPSQATEEASHRDLSRSASILVAAQGRLEGRGETSRLGAAREGILSEVVAVEDQTVRRGDLLARLDCRPDEARREAASADVAAALARRERLVRGAREELRRSLGADREAAEAREQRAAEVRARRENLWNDARVISKDLVDAARREQQAFASDARAARWREALAGAEPLPEELDLADAEVAAARAGLRVVESLLAQCEVLAPTDGTVLRRLVEPGEAVVIGTPLFEFADLSTWRVRAEVDERDLSSVHLAQPTTISAPAFGDVAVRGTVISLGGAMGRKKVRSGDPAEKSDRDVLEVLIELEQAPPVTAIGLRVDTVFLEEAP